MPAVDPRMPVLRVLDQGRQNAIATLRFTAWGIWLQHTAGCAVRGRYWSDAEWQEWAVASRSWAGPWRASA